MAQEVYRRPRHSSWSNLHEFEGCFLWSLERANVFVVQEPKREKESNRQESAGQNRMLEA
jgi:hypothetical protein